MNEIAPTNSSVKTKIPQIGQTCYLLRCDIGLERDINIFFESIHFD